MATFYQKISAELTDFIHRQHIFFVATAPQEGRVNLSPKGMDSLRVIDEQRIIWLNLTGSGNETAAHVLENGRMTLMWCAMEGKPLILRAYGTAKAIHPGEPGFEELADQLLQHPGARQIFDLQIEGVQTSCGYAVPFMDFREERTRLVEGAAKQGPAGIRKYQQAKNRVSIDGLPTGLPK
ncbi:pyridoxamine 5'-phosphate oxidase family protein [Lewinella sp. 4G2]|uniref:pyridoxamine 5'-phosphate oxidase family protein n=1 Tax=Lewinella sp. 4G2 TaxID=1803372 RepID=UPI0007B49AC2|nr:pyridoxamine 5'-phosphate oxidase family protein [Lewinella sp. 4G2]OAV44219.1 pyridoxamine 5'-phosphate oxidase [Lewinella sp. 4G2]